MGNDSFAGIPPTISELRASKTHSGKDWTPRDVLIAALRDYDEGKIKDTDTMIVIWRQKELDGSVLAPGFLQCSPDCHTLWGVIMGTLNRMMNLATGIESP